MFSIEDYPFDVQYYILDEWDASQLKMFKDEVYVNTLGKTFRVLEDSPENEVYVRVVHEHHGGKAIRLVPKVVLVS